MRLIQPKSIADQVEDLLRGRIREGLYAPGSRMPSESELSDEMGVSRATVRTVLAKLAVNGLILRKQGDGTYVNARVQSVSANLGNVWDFSCLIESNGFVPSIQPLSNKLKPASEKEALALAIAPGETLLSMIRLFYADKKPVILAQNVIPFSLIREPIDSIDGSLHIRDILQNYCNQEIAFVITDIHSATASPDVTAVLQKQETDTILELDVSFFSKDNTPLVLGANYFDDSVLRLSLVQAWN